jgi:hypothetical protein
MLDKPKRMLAVILGREAVETTGKRTIGSSGAWSRRGRGVVDCSASRCLSPDSVTLFPDEAEGYYLNASSEVPSVFVSIRSDEAGGDPYPFQATLSYNEAARWMDGGEKVERAPLWPELAGWMGAWVEENYRPEPKKRQRPRSFEGKEGRLREKNGR